MTEYAYVKDPEDVLDYDIDFADARSPWMIPGDTITNVVVELAPGDTSGVVIDDWDWTATVVKVWLSGGTNGATATVEVKATTIQGRTKEVAFTVRIREV